MIISVVVPTYNRPEQLSEVLDHILKSDVQDLTGVEIIVVDDGSPISAKSVVESKNVAAPFTIKYVRQENAGPAKARNTGFQNATGDLVIFIDDDVLVRPKLLLQHVEARKKFPDAFIFGPYPYAIPQKATSAYRYLKSLFDSSLEYFVGENNFIRADTIASGNLSVAKSMISNGEIYKNSLKIPVAEEFELIARLVETDIPIYVGLDMQAWHTQPTNIESKCKQEYKYGMGLAEVRYKYPATLKLESFAHLFYGNSHIRSEDTFSRKCIKMVKMLISPFKAPILKFVKITESLTDSDSLLFPLYRFLIGIYLFAGVRDGIRQFGPHQ